MGVHCLSLKYLTDFEYDEFKYSFLQKHESEHGWCYLVPSTWHCHILIPPPRGCIRDDYNTCLCCLNALRFFLPRAPHLEGIRWLKTGSILERIVQSLFYAWWSLTSLNFLTTCQQLDDFSSLSQVAHSATDRVDSVKPLLGCAGTIFWDSEGSSFSWGMECACIYGPFILPDSSLPLCNMRMLSIHLLTFSHLSF